MKTRNVLYLSLLLYLVSIPACTPDKAETSVAKAPVSNAITEPNKSPSTEKMSPAMPMSPGVPMTKTVPMKGGQGAQTEKIPTLEESALAPDFVSMDLAGKSVHLADFKDSVVVLDFWATWCGPCLASLPHTQEVANLYKDQGVVILAVCTGDTRAKIETWVNANQAKYPDVVFTCDPNERDSATFDERASRKFFGVSGIPTQFVIGRDSKVAAVLVGTSKDDVRLEAGLARVGIEVDATVANLGEEQFKKGD